MYLHGLDNCKQLTLLWLINTDTFFSSCMILIVVYTLSDIQMHTCCVTIEWIRSEWLLSTYYLSDSQAFTIWVTLNCIRSEWAIGRTPCVICKCILSDLSLSIYALGDPSNAYALHNQQESTPCVTFKSVLSGWSSSVYDLSNLQEHTH